MCGFLSFRTTATIMHFAFQHHVLVWIKHILQMCIFVSFHQWKSFIICIETGTFIVDEKMTATEVMLMRYTMNWQNCFIWRITLIFYAANYAKYSISLKSRKRIVWSKCRKFGRTTGVIEKCFTRFMCIYISTRDLEVYTEYSTIYFAS